jgi:miniconductance mechanosensitive channel
VTDSIPPEIQIWLKAAAGIVVLVFLVAVLQMGLRTYIRKIFHRLSQGSRSWAAVLFRDESVSRITAWILPLFIVSECIALVPGLSSKAILFSQRLVLATFVILAARFVLSLLDAVQSIYSQSPAGRSRPIKGYLQGLSILTHLVMVVAVISILMDKSPLIFLSGLGAMTAILVLIFKDTILSLVAGIQLTSNRLIEVGDWIEMPQFDADGDVTEIALHAVKVQNWDHTITVIPTHKFLENSFKNWRGMHESGGRRIKRSVLIDLRSVRFLEASDIEYFSKFYLLQQYIARKLEELHEDQIRKGLDKNGLISNFRRLTNLGTFRAYLVNYLRQHPGIRQDMTFLVRQLQPTSEGLPVEIYVFANDTRLSQFEDIQSNIFDHVLAIAPEFGLRVFQSPSGDDMRALGKES